MFQYRCFVKPVSIILIILVIEGLLASCQKKEYNIYENILQEIEILQDSFDAALEFQDGHLKQSSGTAVTYYTELPQALELYVELPTKPKEAAATISIHADGIESQQFEIDKKGGQSFDLAQFQGKIVGIELKVEPENAALQWDSLVLRSLKTSDGDQQPDQPPLPPIPDLKNYDVIYLVLDAFHAKHASLYGYDRKTTPFLDELAKEAVVFDNMFANAPYTLASTGVLFTSKFAHEHGLIHEKKRLSPITPTISELLSAKDIPSYLITIHGYLIGDWGLSRGFSKIFKERKYGHGPKGQPATAFDNFEKIYAEEPQHSKFIYIHLGPPHSPYMPPEQFRKFIPDITSEKIEPVNENLHKIDQRKLRINDEQLEYIIGWYDSNVLYADYLAQNMIERLRELGVLERCIVVITSDHGEGLLQHKRMLHGSTVFDEMIHVPFIVRFPKELNVSPRHITHLVSLLDVTPTLAEIFGIEPADFSGKSLLPTIFHDQAINPFIYTEALVYENLRAVRDFKYNSLYAVDKKVL
ncbi:sulfatase [Candidatus Vecturithrix granuli]|uniref:Sulfatase n=1 Tax=Vecturithrix granuli TaxID=1499967 RepID=A0A081C6H7_VECG1|nr:sulfatase [Candidatus Vecturithrix granuli]